MLDDLAKKVFALHGVNEEGKVQLKRLIRWSWILHVLSMEGFGRIDDPQKFMRTMEPIRRHVTDVVHP